jgi:4-hydroxybenzoate polyprenyltransferase
LFYNLLGGLVVLTQLSQPALIATAMILPVAGLYPLAKRYVKHPQVVLAACFNSGNYVYIILIGVFICGLTINCINPAWTILTHLYLAGICWTMIYDTVYAFQVIHKIIYKIGHR